MAVRDAEATKARIFEAATAEFAAYGIAGARVDRIAQNAQANKQLIYAYFGDKQKLFYKVLEQALVHVAEMVSTDITDLDKWVDAHIEYHKDHPEFLRLLMWEALESPAEQTCSSTARAERYALKQRKVLEAQGAGLMRADMPPGYMLVLLMGLINYPILLPQLRPLVFGDSFDGEQLREWTRDAVKRVAAIAAEPADATHETDVTDATDTDAAEPEDIVDTAAPEALASRS